MKCGHCGFNNRKGVSFCENCGEPLKAVGGIVCQNCGQKNRPGVKFCEECGALLEKPAALAPMPVEQPQPQVVIIQQPARKKRVRLIWLLLLLLLLLVTCCCLLMYEQVQVPEIVQPWVDPVIEQIRKVLPLPNLPGLVEQGGAQPGKGAEQGRPATCEDFREQLKAADLGAETMCYTTRNECYTDIVGVELYDGLTVDFQWDGDSRKQATCEQKTGYIRCYFTRNTNSDRVSYWIMLDECEEDLGFSSGWLEEQPQAAQPPEPEISEPEPYCCSEVKPEQPVYFRNPAPNGPLFLGFGLQCAGGWQFDPETCATFDAYVGANRDQYWASGECCPDAESPENWLLCQAPLEDQKKSATLIQLRYGECYWEFEFQSPYYAPEESAECPPGESLCEGLCCSIGHCCDWGSGLGCYESCP